MRFLFTQEELELLDSLPAEEEDGKALRGLSFLDVCKQLPRSTATCFRDFPCTKTAKAANADRDRLKTVSISVCKKWTLPGAESGAAGLGQPREVQGQGLGVRVAQLVAGFRASSMDVCSSQAGDIWRWWQSFSQGCGWDAASV